MDVAESGCGVGGSDAAGRTGEEEYSIGRTVWSLSAPAVAEGCLDGAGVLIGICVPFVKCSQVSSALLLRFSSAKDIDTRESRISKSGLDSVSHKFSANRGGNPTTHLSIGALSDAVASSSATFSAKYFLPSMFQQLYKYMQVSNRIPVVEIFCSTGTCSGMSKPPSSHMSISSGP